jgi:SAM-dependent methyltransferase
MKPSAPVTSAVARARSGTVRVLCAPRRYRTARGLNSPRAGPAEPAAPAPPFRPGAFDFAYCIGVAQHTPDPPRAVAQVVRQVKPGGRFCLTIYARRPWTRLYAKYLWRPLTRRLPQPVLLRAIEAAMPVAFPVTDRLFRLPVVGRVARFAIPVANYDRGDFTRAQRYQEAILDTFDMLAPRYDAPMTAREVERVLRAEAARGWAFRARVPINVVGEC